MNTLQRSVYRMATKVAKPNELKQVEEECSKLSNSECWSYIAAFNRASSK